MRNNRLITAVLTSILLAVMALASVAPAAGADAGGPAATGGRLIVQFREGAVAAADASLVSAGVVKVKDLPLVNGVLVDATAEGEQLLRQRADVLRVEPDSQVYLLDGTSGEGVEALAQSTPWGVSRVNAPSVWDEGNQGAGVKVGIIDTGIDLLHPDLQTNIKGGENFVTPGASPQDDHGHGTHVAGTVAAVNNTSGVIGVAPQASLYALKVLDASGYGTVSSIISALDWSVSNGLQVVNLSLGMPWGVGALRDAVVAASRAGIVIVAAAGNSGPGDETVVYPAAYPEVIAVSALNFSDTITYWSSRGPEVELAAPGDLVYSTYPGGYTTMSGTSMASPHVAGAAALVIASGIADGNGDGQINDEVRDRLAATATDIGSAGRDKLYGYGRVDAYYAMTGPATAPTVATGAPTAMGLSSVTLNGDLSSLGTADAVDASFLWGRTSATDDGETAAAALTAPGAYSANVNGLTPGTRYYFRARAAGDGVAYGALRTFIYVVQQPFVATRSTSGIGRTSAVLNGFVSRLGAEPSADVSFLWGATRDLADGETPAVSVSSTGIVSAALEGLTPGTRYYFRAKIAGEVTVYGRVYSFRTLGRAPAAYTRPPTTVTPDSATLNGLLRSLGTAPTAAVSFLWGTTRDTSDGETPVTEMGASGAFSAVLDGLTPGTRYYFRAKAVGDGARLGAIRSFTYVPRPPRAGTYPAAMIGTASATLNARIVSLGSVQTVDVSFLWGTTPAVAGGETEPVAASAPGFVSADLSSLEPGTRYYFRVKVVGDGTSQGAARGFMTLP